MSICCSELPPSRRNQAYGVEQGTVRLDGYCPPCTLYISRDAKNPNIVTVKGGGAADMTFDLNNRNVKFSFSKDSFCIQDVLLGMRRVIYNIPQHYRYQLEELKELLNK